MMLSVSMFLIPKQTTTKVTKDMFPEPEIFPQQKDCTLSFPISQSNFALPQGHC